MLASLRPKVVAPRILRSGADLAHEPAPNQLRKPRARRARGQTDRLRDLAGRPSFATGQRIEDCLVRLIQPGRTDSLGRNDDPKTRAYLLEHGVREPGLATGRRHALDTAI